MARRAPISLTRNNSTMSEAQYFAKLRSLLRHGFRSWWIPAGKTLEDVKRPSQSSNKRLKWEYKCAHCGQWFPHKDVQVDHVIPCGELSCYEDIIPFIQRLFAEGKGAYQVLCTATCHRSKTNSEMSLRREARKLNPNLKPNECIQSNSTASEGVQRKPRNKPKLPKDPVERSLGIQNNRRLRG